MTNFLVQDRVQDPAQDRTNARNAQACGTGWPADQDRRRPGRIENASPELIALMPKPTSTARVRVALYDAPGFLLATDAAARRPGRRNFVPALAALAVSTALWAAMFKTMVWAWG